MDYTDFRIARYQRHETRGDRATLIRRVAERRSRVRVDAREPILLVGNASSRSLLRFTSGKRCFSHYTRIILLPVLRAERG